MYQNQPLLTVFPIVGLSRRPDKGPVTFYANIFFTAVFGLECLFKSLAYGLQYFKEPWNLVSNTPGLLIMVTMVKTINLVKSNIMSGLR
jgi:hypothetical protein